MAGVAGFEPANNGVKVRCLSAWRYPYMVLETGFEPVRRFRQQILSLHCLPVPTL